ncbi:MAG TPA: hypothetical protein VN759_04645 [Pseudolysinimonas sp.]|nr:hypothetical protein [Pseudolysinimonas sp.]
MSTFFAVADAIIGVCLILFSRQLSQWMIRRQRQTRGEGSPRSEAWARPVVLIVIGVVFIAAAVFFAFFLHRP